MSDSDPLLTGGVVLLVFVLFAVLFLAVSSDARMAGESTQVTEATADEGPETLKRGTFSGLRGYDVSGTVVLLRDGEGLYLRFENYSRTRAPDAVVYVTPWPAPETRAEIATGWQVPEPAGREDGTFTRRLPDGVETEDVESVVVWSDRYATPLGYAEMAAASPMA